MQWSKLTIVLYEFWYDKFYLLQLIAENCIAIAVWTGLGASETRNVLGTPELQE